MNEWKAIWVKKNSAYFILTYKDEPSKSLAFEKKAWKEYKKLSKQGTCS